MGYKKSFELTSSGEFNGVYKTETPLSEDLYTYYRDSVDKDQAIHFTVEKSSNGKKFHISWPIPDTGVNYSIFYNKDGREFPRPYRDNSGSIRPEYGERGRKWRTAKEDDLKKAATEFPQKVYATTT